MDIHRQDFQQLKIPLKRYMVLPGNQAIGTPIALTILQRVRGIYSLDGVNSLGSCPPSDARCSRSWLHTINWIKKGNQKVSEICVVLWHYDRILPLQSVFLCLPPLKQKLVEKVVLFIFRQHLHVLQELMCLRRATCLSYSPFTR